jgi:nucleotide-binding universal stress UspA family protein
VAPEGTSIAITLISRHPRLACAVRWDTRRHEDTSGRHLAWPPLWSDRFAQGGQTDQRWRVAMIEIGHVLCPVDFSEFSRRAVDHAIAMARWYEARLTVLHVFVNRPTMDLPPLELTSIDRERLLTDMKQLVGEPPPHLSIEYLVREAPDVWREVLDQIDSLKADLLVIGSHGRSGFEKLFLGSVTEKVLRKAACPVMIVPRRAPDADQAGPVRFARILCPVDFSEGSLRALTYALSIAQEADARLSVLHVIEMPPELREHYPITGDVDIDQVHAAAEAASLRRLRELVPAAGRTYCTVETVVREGAAYRQILKVAGEQGSDVIVMGVQGRGAMDLMMFGSNTSRVIRAATCPVLTVRQ